MAGASTEKELPSEEDKKCPVLEAWSALPGLVQRASTQARICHVGSAGVSRQSVIDNVEITEAIVQTFGPWPHFSFT